MELLKENKKIFISAGIIFIVLFIVIFLLSLFNKNSNNLVLRCTKDMISENNSIKHTISFYDYSDYKNVELDTFFSVDENTDEYYDNYSNLIYKDLEARMVSIFGENYTDVTLSMKKKKNGFDIIQNLSINSNNSVKMYDVLGYDYWNTSIEELRTTLEGGGFSCK